MANGHGGARNGAGRPRKRDKNRIETLKAEKKIRGWMPDLLDNMKALADGGFEIVDEEWLPAGLVRVGKGDFEKPAFPKLEPTEMVLVKRKVSTAGRDRQANTYLIDRIMGAPSQKMHAEVTGANGGPIESQATVIILPSNGRDEDKEASFNEDDDEVAGSQNKDEPGF